MNVVGHQSCKLSADEICFLVVIVDDFKYYDLQKKFYQMEITSFLFISRATYEERMRSSVEFQNIINFKEHGIERE